MSARARFLRDRLRSLEPALPDDDEGLEAFEVLPDEREILEAAGLSSEVIDKGLRAKSAVVAGDDVDDESMDGLEAIILVERPVVDVENGFCTIRGEFAKLNRFEPQIRSAIAATGRVEAKGIEPYVGSAFLVAKRIVMTNRHVAQKFSDGVGLTVSYRSGTSVDLEREVSSKKAGPTMKVKQVVMVHPYWDMALLEVDDDHGRSPLTLLDSGAVRGTDVVVIGYPYFDTRSEKADLQRLFRGEFGVKRLLPGRLGTYTTYESFDNPVRALKHDASTLGGSSGSPIFDPARNGVIALHFAGEFEKTNVGVPADELLCDPAVCRALGLPAPKRNAGRHVAEAWRAVTRLSAAVPAARPDLGVPVRTRRRHEGVADGQVELIARARDWYERIDEDTLADLLQRDRAPTLGLLAEAVGHEEAEEAEELLFSPAPVDPALPEIVLLHGIMGGHLDSVGASRERIWLSPKGLLLSNFAGRLELASDGLTDLAPGVHIQPAGLFRFFYAKAARRWRSRGFVVHEWSYDWRKSLEVAAQRLDLFLRTLALDRPGRPLCIVAHSMGALVANVAAAKCPGFMDRVERAVFLGPPLGGSFAPLQAALGTYPFMVKLAAWAPGVDIEDLRRMSRTLPGLLELLPSPALFPDCEHVYQAAAWPQICRPEQLQLDRARRLKEDLVHSPLLARAAVLVALDRPTVAGIAGDGAFATGPAIYPGDGTVPARAMLLPGVSAYQVDVDHALMPRDDATIDKAASLLSGATVAGLVGDGFPVDEPLPVEEAPPIEGWSPGSTPAGRDLTARDLEWLFASNMEPLRRLGRRDT